MPQYFAPILAINTGHVGSDLAGPLYFPPRVRPTDNPLLYAFKTERELRKKGKKRKNGGDTIIRSDY